MKMKDAPRWCDHKNTRPIEAVNGYTIECKDCGARHAGWKIPAVDAEEFDDLVERIESIERIAGHNQDVGKAMDSIDLIGAEASRVSNADIRKIVRHIKNLEEIVHDVLIILYGSNQDMGPMRKKINSLIGRLWRG